MTGAERNLTLASRNLEGVKLVPTREVTVYDLLAHKQVVLSRSRSPQAVGGAGRMNVYEVIRRPIVTEKAVLKKDEAKHAVLRSCSRREQDPDQGRGPEGLRVKVAEVQTVNNRRQAAPPRPVLRLPLGLEESLRAAEGGREDAGVHGDLSRCR